MSTINQSAGYRQAQQIARAAYHQREAQPVESFRRWTMAALLMRRAYLAQSVTEH